MKSIRLSLIVYFLALLAVALGAVSFLVFRTTSQALKEKQEANRKLLIAQHDERRREEIARLDNDLLLHARALANIAQSQFEANRLKVIWYFPLGLLSAVPSPNGHLTAPLWIAEYKDYRVFDVVSGALATEVNLNEELIPRTDERTSDLAQVNGPRGRPWRSKSLNDGFLPFDEEDFRDLKMFDWRFDDLELAGTKLRRVRLKSPIVRFRYLPPTSRVPYRRPPPPPNPGVRDAAPFYIQWATDRSERDEVLNALEQATSEKLRASDEESLQALSTLRRKLGWISLATFAAVCVGASLLVRVGLSPLRRLGDAVSRVSASNFSLQFEGPPPPAELAPIIERLQQSLTMLQRAFDREKQSTADISHELRTPLAALMTMVEVALRKPRASEDYIRTLQDCREVVRQMSQMIERLLALSWLDSRSDAIRSEPVDASELADQCATVIRPLAEASGLTLRVSKEAPVRIRTDAGKVREIISNLLHNAVEYNRPGGSIDLDVRTTPTGLDVAVSDTGIGVAKEHQDKIFERFFRADDSRQAIGIHAGLGLSIVRGYVSLLGGTITLESEVGRGSTFRVHVPTTAA